MEVPLLMWSLSLDLVFVGLWAFTYAPTFRFGPDKGFARESSCQRDPSVIMAYDANASDNKMVVHKNLR